MFKTLFRKIDAGWSDLGVGTGFFGFVLYVFTVWVGAPALYEALTPTLTAERGEAILYPAMLEAKVATSRNRLDPQVAAYTVPVAVPDDMWFSPDGAHDYRLFVLRDATEAIPSSWSYACRPPDTSEHSIAQSSCETLYEAAEGVNVLQGVFASRWDLADHIHTANWEAVSMLFYVALCALFGCMATISLLVVGMVRKRRSPPVPAA